MLESIANKGFWGGWKTQKEAKKHLLEFDKNECKVL